MQGIPRSALHCYCRRGLTPRHSAASGLPCSCTYVGMSISCACWCAASYYKSMHTIYSGSRKCLSWFDAFLGGWDATGRHSSRLRLLTTNAMRCAG